VRKPMLVASAVIALAASPAASAWVTVATDTDRDPYYSTYASVWRFGVEYGSWRAVVNAPKGWTRVRFDVSCVDGLYNSTLSRSWTQGYRSRGFYYPLKRLLPSSFVDVYAYGEWWQGSCDFDVTAYGQRGRLRVLLQRQ
jgi:hypothetical protein